MILNDTATGGEVTSCNESLDIVGTFFVKIFKFEGNLDFFSLGEERNESGRGMRGLIAEKFSKCHASVS